MSAERGVFHRWPLSFQLKAIKGAYRTFGDAPLVLAGDFNTKPEDSELAFMQTGQLSEQDTAYPEPFEGEESLNLDHFKAGELGNPS